MYNTRFLPQLEGFRRHLFGEGAVDLRGVSPEQYSRYFPPPGVKVHRCYEDTNGEWVPESDAYDIGSLECKADC